jgi:hypothetical protein
MIGGCLMKHCLGPVLLKILVLLSIVLVNRTNASELKVEIRSPKDGLEIRNEQNYVLIGGKVTTKLAAPAYVDIFLVLDVSGSTAHYAGVEFPEVYGFPNLYYTFRSLPCVGPTTRRRYNLRSSILAAEIIASRRLLSQLNSATTRVGLITFSEEIWLRQKLTHDFDEVRAALDVIYKQMPARGTNMADAISVGIDELLGKGESETYLDSIKTMILLSDGTPNRPIGDCSSSDADLAISRAESAGRAGISIHVLALGKDALSGPRAAVGIAKESGGTYTAVMTPADVVMMVDKVSVVGVESVEVTNETSQQKALRSRLTADGFFASAVPVVAGLNRIQVVGRAKDGAVARDAITIDYRPGEGRSLNLEIFLEQEKSLQLEIDRLGTKPK